MVVGGEKWITQIRTNKFVYCQMWWKSKCQNVKDGDQPKMTETHAKHKTNGVSVTKENEQGNQNVLTKTNARVTPTQERPWLWLQNFEKQQDLHKAPLFSSLTLA